MLNTTGRNSVALCGAGGCCPGGGPPGGGLACLCRCRPFSVAAGVAAGLCIAAVSPFVFLLRNVTIVDDLFVSLAPYTPQSCECREPCSNEFSCSCMRCQGRMVVPCLGLSLVVEGFICSWGSTGRAGLRIPAIPKMSRGTNCEQRTYLFRNDMAGFFKESVSQVHILGATPLTFLQTIFVHRHPCTTGYNSHPKP